MTIEEMKARKIELGYSNEELSKISGVPLGTLQKIFSGATKAPRKSTLTALACALSPSVSIEHSGRGYMEHARMLRESTPNYGSKNALGPVGPYRLADYLALPDDVRVELIDGYYYDMASPTVIHQAIISMVLTILINHVTAHGGSCMPLASPVDVQLDEDDLTVVQPDILILCDREKFREGRIFGAPDFVIEILSPSGSKKDMITKLGKYSNAGVREYWIVDPRRKRIIVYDFENDDFITMYTFKDKVPVGIWNAECEVDFAKIYEQIGFLYQ